MTTNPNSASVHPMVTRFRVGSNRPPDRLTLHVSSISPLPKSYRDAFRDQNWQNAMRDEYTAHIKNNTWTLVPRLLDTNIVRCMWLFCHKYLDDGMLSRYKARLVANGSTQMDDIVLTASSQALLQQIISSLHKEFSMTDLDSLNYFLGIFITRDSSRMFLSQKKYAVEILERAGMVNCNPSRTHVDTESKLGATDDVVFDPTLYRSLAGSLQYLTFTRPDISYAVQQVCLHMHDPREPHFSALTRILRYVRGTLDYGLQLFSSSTIDLVAYSDADWAGFPTTRRLTSDYCVFLGNSLLSWSSKRQPTLSRSSVEAEYRGVAKRTKHIEIDIHFVRDLVAADQVWVLHVPSRYQFADIFTKGLPSSLFEAFRSSLSIRCSPAPIAEDNLFNLLSQNESSLLEQPFSLQEIKDAVWSCGGEKAPGPNGLTFKLIKKHWSLFSEDIFSYVKEFESSGFIPRGCNSSFITLVPKIDDPLSLNDYRPISLIGRQYKIIAKLFANRLSTVISSVVSNVQMAFIKGRQIIDCPLIVDEIISWAKLFKRKMFILKVDFEKAFDTLINGSPTLEFKLEKGLRQGDPLSLLLFIIAMEALNVVLVEAKSKQVFHGIEVGKDKVHVSHLQFADDAIILGEWSKPNIKNLSRILTCFYLASGLKVNFNKSKFFGIGINESELYSFASSIGCQPSYLPCTYLGLPIGANMSRSLNWNPLIERFLKRLTRWKANSLSFGGRLTLAKSVLGSLGVYFFSTFKTPKMIIKKLESIRRKFFLGGSSDVNNIAWVAWDRVIAPFSNGGLNIESLSVSNLGLLSKWWWRFLSEENSFWCKVICSIHGPQGGLRDASLIRSKSGPWYRIAKLNEDLSVHGIDLHSLFKIKIGNGENTRFWIDKWVGDAQLSIDFPRLFRLETQPLCRVCDRYPFSINPPTSFVSDVPVLAEGVLVNQPTHAILSRPISDCGPPIPDNGRYDPPRLRFRWAWNRDLRSADYDELIQLQSLLCNLQVTSDQDKWECLIDSSRRFSVKGMRKLIMDSSPLSYANATRWNKLVPIKVNIASCRIENRRIPTRVNLDSRGIDLHSTRCPICDDDLETEDHVLVKCDVALNIWREVLKWWGLNNIQVDNLNDVFSLSSRSNLTPKVSILFDAVVQSTLWFLWRFRNEFIFASKRPNKDLILNDIKHYTFVWISNRLRKVSCNWLEWLFNPQIAVCTPL
ncbi:putative RNA-directed DNA polymerase [Tanacetum coccineum]